MFCSRKNSTGFQEGNPHVIWCKKGFLDPANFSQFPAMLDQIFFIS